MSLLEVTQSQPASITVLLLTENTGIPRTGLIDTDIAVSYAKEGESTFTQKVLSGSDLTELTPVGSGIYRLSLTAAELDTVGTFVFSINGVSELSPQIRNFVKELLVVESSVSPTPPVAAFNTITGSIFDGSNNPVVNVAVTAELKEVPTILSGAGISEEMISTKTDANGFFELDLIQGGTFVVRIPAMNYRRLLTVPTVGTSDLFAIP